MHRIMGALMGEVEVGVIGDYRSREINAVLILCYLKVSNSNLSGIRQDSLCYSCGMLWNGEFLFQLEQCKKPLTM